MKGGLGVAGILGAVAAVAVLAGMGLAQVMHAQSQSRLKAWQIGHVVGHDVGVIDTGGVCIYVSDGAYSGGLFVVPKTRLPIGHGCQ